MLEFDNLTEQLFNVIGRCKASESKVNSIRSKAAASSLPEPRIYEMDSNGIIVSRPEKNSKSASVLVTVPITEDKINKVREIHDFINSNGLI